MIMDIKFIYLLGLVYLFISCDPNSRDISFSINNETSQVFKISLFKNSKENAYEILELSSIEFLRYSALGGRFSAIADYDSLKIINIADNRNLKWIKPSNNYGYIDTDNNIGEDRNIEKDIYYRKNWTLQANGDDEEWIFTINESDLELFE